MREFAVAAVFAAFAGCSGPPPPADLILHNGAIVTLELRGGRRGRAGRARRTRDGGGAGRGRASPAWSRYGSDRPRGPHRRARAGGQSLPRARRRSRRRPVGRAHHVRRAGRHRGARRREPNGANSSSRTATGTRASWWNSGSRYAMTSTGRLPTIPSWSCAAATSSSSTRSRWSGSASVKTPYRHPAAASGATTTAVSTASSSTAPRIPCGSRPPKWKAIPPSGCSSRFGP